MSIQSVGWAIEQQDVPARPALVLISIANHADHTNGYCWLKAETIAREARCKPRSVFRYIGALVRNGYIRKAPKRGEDGKQRANDYWLMFAREQKPWDWGGDAEDDTAEHETPESEPSEDDTQDVVSPHDTVSHGETAQPTDSGVTRQPVEKHAVSHGPHDSGVTRKRIAEPSKINSRESSARENAISGALRHYRPPPPQPVGEVFDNAKQFFAFEGTRAYEAWAKVRAHEQGIRSWHLTTRKLVDGKWRSGWYFPTLFPPESKSTGPPDLSEDDKKAFIESS